MCTDCKQEEGEESLISVAVEKVSTKEGSKEGKGRDHQRGGEAHTG